MAQVLEGAWEDIRSHDEELVGRWVRVIVDDEHSGLSNGAGRNSAGPAQNVEQQAREMNLQWPDVWLELRFNVEREGVVTTLGQGVRNQIVEVDRSGITVRSERTGRDRNIPESEFRTWWQHISDHGRAALKTDDPDCPDPKNSSMVCAILAAGLPRLISVERDPIVLMANRNISSINIKMLRTLDRIHERHKGMRETPGDSTQRLLREARNGGMYGLEPIDPID
jgi:hypothetical protein